MPKGVGPEEYIVDPTTGDIKVPAKRTLADYLSKRTKGGSETFSPSQQGGGEYTYAPPRSNAYPITSTSDPSEIGADASYVSPTSSQDVFVERPDMQPSQGSPILAGMVSLSPSSREPSTNASTGHTLLVDVAGENPDAKSEVYDGKDGVFSNNDYTPAALYASGSSDSPYDNFIAVDGTGRGYTGDNNVSLISDSTVEKAGDYLSSITSGKNPVPLVDSAQAGGIYRNTSPRANEFPIAGGSTTIRADSTTVSPHADESTQSVYADASSMVGLKGNPVLTGMVSLEPSSREPSTNAASGHSLLESVAEEGSSAKAEVYDGSDGAFSGNVYKPGEEFGSGLSSSPYDSFVPVDGAGAGYTGDNSVDYRDPTVVESAGTYASNVTRGESATPLVDSTQAGGLYRNNSPRSNKYPVAAGSAEIGADATSHSPSEDGQTVFADATTLANDQGNSFIAGLVSRAPSSREATTPGAADGNEILQRVSTDGDDANASLYSADDGAFGKNAYKPGSEYGNGDSGDSSYDSAPTPNRMGAGYTPGNNSVNLKSSANLTTLGTYLSQRTRGVDPDSPVEARPTGGLYSNNSTRSNKYPVPDGSTEIGAGAKDVSPGQFSPEFTNQRPTSYPETVNVVKLDPSARSVGSVDGNDALNSSATVSSISTVLSRNRFTSGNKFTAGSFNDGSPTSGGTLLTSGNPTASGENVFTTMRRAAMVSMLNAAGENTSLNSMSEKGPRASDVASVTNKVQQGLSKVEFSTLQPLAGRSLIPSPSIDETTDTQRVIRSPSTEFADAADIGGVSDPQYNNKSFGQLNTYLEQFSGPGTTNIILLAITAYVALFAATAIVSFIFSLIIGKLKRPDPTTINLPMGAERGADFGKFFFDPDVATSQPYRTLFANIGNLIARILGIMQPYGGPDAVSYFLAALEGALSLIGVNVDEIGSNPASILTTALPNILINFGLTPSYYLILTRTIARDFSLLADEGSFSGAYQILETIRSIKIVRFVDNCARIGIINRQQREGGDADEPDSPASILQPIGGDKNSPLGLNTNVYDVAQKRVGRSKETSSSRRLAWSHSSLGYTRSEMVTKDLIVAMRRTGVGRDSEKATAALRNLKARKVVSETGRISAVDREYHEQLLDAEYMPFYFHDLRTNEILSFHAFLSALTDSFTANYNSVDGFGRMDPVQIYKNTTRAISFTFSVVATSPEDHQQMWYSINKLVNMVYPQWSEGDIVSGSGEVFTQPFSQTIASSPMLRVRIGELVHSNYSRFALQRIFGLDKQGATLKDDKGASINVSDTGVFEIKEHLDETKKNSGQESSSGYLKKTLEDQRLSPVKAAIPAVTTGDAAAYNLNNPEGINSPYVLNNVALAAAETFAVNSKMSHQTIYIKPGKYDCSNKNPADPASSAEGDDTVTKKRKISGGTNGGIVVGYIEAEKTEEPYARVVVKLNPTATKIEGNTDYPHYKTKVFGGELKPLDYVIVPPEAISNPMEVLEKISSLLGSLFGAASAQTAKEPPPVPDVAGVVNRFMSPTTNHVVRSFEEGSGGRGLAGFITQLGLEYGITEGTWNTDVGSRAPNMVTISVTFSPIHDIPMGLAADGTSRAAAYPVGQLNRDRFFPELSQYDAAVATKKSGG